MPSKAIRRSIFATLLAAAGSLAFDCSLVEAQGSDTSGAPIARALPIVESRKRRRNAPGQQRV
jgi:hypothetical protein